MTTRSFLVATMAALLLILISSPTLCGADETPKAVHYFDHGMMHLRQGQLEAALAAFQQASEAEPQTERYSRQAMIVKRVIGIRKYVDENGASPKWERMASALHAFYLQHQGHAPALALARRAHGLLKNGGSEARLAEALLASGHDAETATLLGAKVTWPRDLRHGVFYGIALARLGRADDARKLAPRLVPAKDAEPTLLRDRARLDTLLGDRAAALGRLQAAFVATPDTGLVQMKDSVLQCPDFASLFGTPEFEKVMKTQSGVKTTSCSGGSDCGSCPKRGGCKGRK
jgi:tetratricopeptide (TPR) repeat protein